MMKAGTYTATRAVLPDPKSLTGKSVLNTKNSVATPMYATKNTARSTNGRIDPAGTYPHASIVATPMQTIDQ